MFPYLLFQRPYGFDIRLTAWPGLVRDVTSMTCLLTLDNLGRCWLKLKVASGFDCSGLCRGSWMSQNPVTIQ